MKTAEEQARTVWATWLRKHRKDWGFAGEVANYLNVREDGLLIDIENGLRAFASAWVQKDRETCATSLERVALPGILLDPPQRLLADAIRRLPIEIP